MPAVAHEVHRWRRLAEAIPDRPIRHDALDALTRKRGQTDGAALFSILSRWPNRHLLRALVSYQILWDFLDSAGERCPTERNGRQLNHALIDALEVAGPFGDYYRHHPCHEDGGYLRALVARCRAAVSKLPGYPLVRALVLREAQRAEVLSLNHELDPCRKVTLLEGWAQREFPCDRRATWFELTGAASAGLTIFALLALAAEPACSEAQAVRTANAYFPWPGALATMLDSYVDRDEDQASGAHIYVSYYAAEELVRRTGDLIRRALGSVSELPDPHRHSLIIASMVAMYLSKDSARAPHMKKATAAIASEGGSLTALLLPVLRLWRTIYKLRAM